MEPKGSKVVTLDEGSPPTKSFQIRYRCYVANKKCFISTLAKRTAPKLSRVMRMSELQPQSHITHQPRGQVTSQKRYICIFTETIAPKILQGADSG